MTANGPALSPAAGLLDRSPDATAAGGAGLKCCPGDGEGWLSATGRGTHEASRTAAASQTGARLRMLRSLTHDGTGANRFSYTTSRTRPGRRLHGCSLSLLRPGQAVHAQAARTSLKLC